jgi:DNA-binding NarL/FixJ family response regulator
MSNFFQKYFKKPKEVKKITIIHCDDHALFRYGVRTALLKYTDIEIIAESSNGVELLKQLEILVPDMVILNIQMPIMNGIEALPKIKEKYPNLKVIVLSMHNDKDVITKMMQLGANSYLTKNTNSDIIYQAIKCVNEFNYYYSEAVERAFLGSTARFVRIGHEYSSKELQIIELLQANKTEMEIAGIMDISERTVFAIKEKLKRKQV